MVPEVIKLMVPQNYVFQEKTAFKADFVGDDVINKLEENITW